VTFGLRPEDFGSEDHGTHQTTLRAELVENLGGTAYLYTEAGRETAIVAELPRRSLPAPGESRRFGIDGAEAFLFASDGARL
jgi:ABC-type sugar transport system ATPase subunit